MPSNKIAFQGEPGAYSEEALFLLAPDAESQPHREFRDVAQAVLDRRAHYGLLPIENSLVGSIATNFDLIAESGLAIVGEVVSAVQRCLLGVPGAGRAALRRVLSHPVALAQCERFLRGLSGVEVVAFYDTAGAAAEVARRADASLGAVAGALAARRYGLAVLAERIEDEPHNQTRVLVVAREPAPPPPGVPAKTTSRRRLDSPRPPPRDEPAPQVVHRYSGQDEAEAQGAVRPRRRIEQEVQSDEPGHQDVQGGEPRIARCADGSLGARALAAQREQA